MLDLACYEKNPITVARAVVRQYAAAQCECTHDHREALEPGSTLAGMAHHV